MTFPNRLIELGMTTTYKKFSQVTVTGNQRLLDLLSSKQGELYPTMYFYQGFTNFSTEHGILFCRVSSYNPDKIDYFFIVDKKKFERICPNEIKFVEYKKKNIYQQQKNYFYIKKI